MLDRSFKILNIFKLGWMLGFVFFALGYQLSAGQVQSQSKGKGAIWFGQSSDIAHPVRYSADSVAVTNEIDTSGNPEVEKVWLHYSSGEETWEKKQMRKNYGRYKAYIPIDRKPTPEYTINYYLSATSASGDKATDPEYASRDTNTYHLKIIKDSTRLLHMPFNEEEGQLPADHSIYNLALDVNGTVSYGAGPIDDQQSIVFRQKDSTNINVPSSILHVPLPQTAVIEFKITGHNQQKYSNIISNYEVNYLYPEYGLNLVSTDSSDRYKLSASFTYSKGYSHPFLGEHGFATDDIIEKDKWYRLVLLMKSPPELGVFALNTDAKILGKKLIADEDYINSGPSDLDETLLTVNKEAKLDSVKINQISVYNYIPSDFQTITDISNPEQQIPNKILLNKNYPNPFNPTTQIGFNLPQATQVKLTVYDVLGRQIAVLVDGKRHAGKHTVTFRASDLSSGVYIYRLKAGEYRESRKMLLLK